MKNKHLVLISFDTKAGGISNMIGIHSLALVREGYSLSIILPKFSDAINSIDNYVKLDHLISYPKGPYHQSSRFGHYQNLF